LQDVVDMSAGVEQLGGGGNECIGLDVSVTTLAELQNRCTQMALNFRQ
jgi:hypothetical protein